MKRIMGLGIVFATVLVLALPFFGGAGPSFLVPASAAETGDGLPIAASSLVVSTGSGANAPAALAAIATIGPAVPVTMNQAPTTTDSEHVAQKPVPKPIPVTAAGAGSGTNERRAARVAAGLSCPGNVGGAPGGAPGVTSAGGVGGTTSGDLASFASTYNAIRVA